MKTLYNRDLKKRPISMTETNRRNVGTCVLHVIASRIPPFPIPL